MPNYRDLKAANEPYNQLQYAIEERWRARAAVEELRRLMAEAAAAVEADIEALRR